MHFCHIVGARPNFMKAAPVLRALSRSAGVRQSLVHTGQHYDFNMSDVFFRQLSIPEPDFNLGVGAGSHAQQTAEIMARLEPVFLDTRPDWVVVYGDVNSTVAAALVAAKLHISIAHVEAGLRSFDRAMPEEINRLLTDQLADLLFTPSSDGDENLIHEGIDASRIQLVGNVMIDTLVRLLPQAGERLPTDLPERFALVTLHRPSNVDDNAQLKALAQTLLSVSQKIDVLFSVHPRTRQRFSEFGINLGNSGRLRLLEPQPYIQFLGLQQRATMIITDSGGIQEEATFLHVPCLTLRENTERPITVTSGSNTIVGHNWDLLFSEVEKIVAGNGKQGAIPPLWDGKAAERIADSLVGAEVGRPIAVGASAS